MPNADSTEVEFVERIKHVHSRFRTNDEELSFALTIGEVAETIEVVSVESDDTKVIVFTREAVYHFYTFRTDYVGHASRTLVELLVHFEVNLPLSFIMAHRTFTVYLSGDKLVSGDDEYPIAKRNEGFELVELVTLPYTSRILDTILRLSETYEVEPVEVVETAVTLVYERVVDPVSAKASSTLERYTNA